MVQLGCDFYSASVWCHVFCEVKVGTRDIEQILNRIHSHAPTAPLDLLGGGEGFEPTALPLSLHRSHIAVLSPVHGVGHFYQRRHKKCAAFLLGSVPLGVQEAAAHRFVLIVCLNMISCILYYALTCVGLSPEL